MSQSRSVRRCASTQSPPQAPLPSHGYIDNEADPDLGYHQFGARTYDPKLRRWLSPDPRVFAQPEIDLATTRQLNLYSYAGNDPARHSDPSGELVFLLVIPAISLAEAGVFAALATATVGTLAWAADQPPPSFAAGEARVRAWTGTTARTAVFANSNSGTKPEAEAESAPSTPADTQGDSAVAPPKNGETSATKAGRKAHTDWDPGEGFEKEVRLDNGKRADAVNRETQEVKELKPDNPRAIKLGEKQVDGYRQELERMYPGTSWTGSVVTYTR